MTTTVMLCMVCDSHTPSCYDRPVPVKYRSLLLRNVGIKKQWKSWKDSYGNFITWEEDPASTAVKFHGQEKTQTISNIFLNWITNVTFGIHFEINYCFLFVVLSVCFLHFVKQGNKMKLLCFLLILLCVWSQFIFLDVRPQQTVFYASTNEMPICTNFKNKEIVYHRVISGTPWYVYSSIHLIKRHITP